MDYVQTIESDKLSALFDELPRSLLGRKVAVTIRPIPEVDTSLSLQDSAFGCLRKYANASLIPKENGAWEQAVKENYAANS